MPHSQKQVRYAHAVASGKGKKKDGMPPAVAKEILGAMHGRKMSSLPERSHKSSHNSKKKKLFHSKKGY